MRTTLYFLGLFALGLLIADWPSVATTMPDAVRIPVVKPHGKGPQEPPALFRHSLHSAASCVVCHPGLFPRYRLGFTHAEMNDGRFCATCHDGRAATAINDYKCEACHVPK